MRALRTIGAGVLVASLLAGCGLFGRSDPDPGPDPTGSGSTSDAPTVDGPSPEDLSREVLDAAAAQQEAPAIASASGTSEANRAMTVEVLAVEPVQDATLVTMRWIGGGTGDSALGPVEFGTQKYDGQGFARALYLVDDTVSRTRYLPLQFEDYREACACPALPLQVGAAPNTVTALFPPLPDGVTTVDLAVGDPAWVTVPDVPVGG